MAPGAASRKAQAEHAAHQLLDSLGAQQAFAMLGWQQNPDYMPPRHCFEHWHHDNALGPRALRDCEQHVKDLSRLYASYGVNAPAIIFKSAHYWDQKAEFDLVWPALVEKWKAAGGRQDNASYLDHPGCAKPLQQGWTGSDFFYDGREHPICRAHKIELLESQRKR